MDLVELGRIYLEHYRAVKERAHKEQPPPANRSKSEIHFVSYDPSHPELEAAILKAIEQCQDFRELQAFLALEKLNEYLMQTRFNALERWLELGGEPQEALYRYQLALALYADPFPYGLLAKELFAALEKLRTENAPLAAYDQLRLETVERIKELQQQGKYVLDPPERWAG